MAGIPAVGDDMELETVVRAVMAAAIFVGLWIVVTAAVRSINRDRE